MSVEEGKHEPHLDAQPEKPALVDERRKKKKEKKALTWDEHAIEEHDLLRGTRMKIEEPNTPYHYDNPSHSDNESESSYRSINNSTPGGAPNSNIDNHHNNANALNWDHLENKLGAVAAAQMCPSSPSASSMAGNSSGADSDVEAEKRRRRLKKKEFELHRKAHYNEMEAVMRWRQEHNDDDEDESMTDS